jgi:hypothetical protein
MRRLLSFRFEFCAGQVFELRLRSARIEDYGRGATGDALCQER